MVPHVADVTKQVVRNYTSDGSYIEYFRSAVSLKPQLAQSNGQEEERNRSLVWDV